MTGQLLPKNIKKHRISAFTIEDLNFNIDNVTIKDYLLGYKSLVESPNGTWEPGWVTNDLEADVSFYFKDINDTLTIFIDLTYVCYYIYEPGDGWNREPYYEFSEENIYWEVSDYIMENYDINLSESQIITILEELTDIKKI